MKNPTSLFSIGLAIAPLALTLAASGQNAAAPQQSKLFDSGQEGYPRYRIPVVIAAPHDGEVLAFCEGRVGGGGFTGDIDIVMKRSTDSGKTWGPLEKIADDGTNTCGYPLPVIDREKKTLFLLYTVSIGADLEKEIVAGTKKPTRVFVISTPDSGKTWTPPAEITEFVRKKNWTWYGLGSGTGIQLRNGRLIVPAYHNVAGSKEFSSHVIISDDRGKTWKLGHDAGGQTGECTVAERRDGTLMLNARNQSGENWSYAPFGTGVKPEGPQFRQRLVADSTDAGETWGEVRSDDELPEPVCQGMLYAWPEGGPDGRPLWFFSNPAGPKRQNLTIRISRDEGGTWPQSKLIHPLGSEYSCLTRLPDGDLGLLYERWEDNNVRIYWSKIPLAWLLK